jgi:hypothetical protein
MVVWLGLECEVKLFLVLLEAMVKLATGALFFENF